MEANKPFKTISLEERLASSVMAKFDPEKSKSATQSNTAQLKLIGNAQEKNAAILKQMARTVQQPVIPAPAPFEKSDVSFRDIRDVYATFPKTIRLENRLAQPLDSRTTHLAKFFLSDSYSGIVKATPFTTSPLAQRVNLDAYGLGDKKPSTFFQEPSPTKGSPILREPLRPLTPIDTQSTSISISNPNTSNTVLLSQGTATSNGAFISQIQIKQSASDSTILVNQGTRLSNNIFTSVAETRLSVIPDLLQQGGVNPKKAVKTTDNAILQGLLLFQGEVDSSVLKVNQMDPIPLVINGVRRYPKAPKLFELPRLEQKQVTTPTINATGQPQQPTTSYKLFAPILQNADSDLSILNKELVGYSSVALPFEYTPSPYSTPTLKVANYEADRLLARFAPEVKHGSVAPKSPKPTPVQGATEVDPESLVPTQQYGPNKPFFNTGNAISPLPAGAQSDTYWTSNSSGVRPAIYQSGANVGFGNVNTQVWSSIVQALTNGTSLPLDSLTDFPSGTTSKGSLARYKALSYGQIDARAVASAGNAGKSAQAASGPNPQIGTGNRTVQNVPDFNGKDYISVKIKSKRGVGPGSVVFKAYLTSFSDSFSTSWNDVQYVGRQDTFKQFKGVTRGVSFGLSVPSFSKVDLPINMKKIQDAISITSVASFNGNYLTGPICSLTIGGFFKDVYCVFNSFKVDFDPAESTWDIDSGLPHLLKVSFDASMLGDANGKGFDASTSRYYSYA